jgi:cytoskeletal protein CcmA (bactofilin family)
MSFWNKHSQAAGTTPDVDKILGPELPGVRQFHQFHVAPGVRIRGDLETTGHAYVEGVVEGAILVGPRTLSIGTQGRVHGDVCAGTVLIRGRLTGDVTASEGVEIAAGAAVLGNIKSPRFVLFAGAVFSGRVDAG